MSGVLRVALAIAAVASVPYAIAEAQPRAERTTAEPAAADRGAHSVHPDAGAEREGAADSVELASAPRVAVFLLPVGDELAPEMADALTELLIAGVVARGEGVTVVGKEELQARLGHGDAESARCLESQTCLGRLGVELGIREVIAGTIASRSGRLWRFDLHRVDVRDGQTLGRVFREVRGELEALLRALEEAVPELYVRPVRPGRLVVRASVLGAVVELDEQVIGRFEQTPLRRETVEPGMHVLRVRAPGHRIFERTIEVEEGATLMIDAILERAGGFRPSPLVWIGGAVAVVGAITAIPLGVASQGEPSPAITMREAVERFYPAREAEATAANIALGIAGAGLAVLAVGLAISGEDDAPREAASARAWLAPVPGTGAAAGVAGRF